MLGLAPSDDDWMAAFDGGATGGELDLVHIGFHVPIERHQEVMAALERFDKSKNIALVKMCLSCLEK
jgi:hypothetical protein